MPTLIPFENNKGQKILLNRDLTLRELISNGMIKSIEIRKIGRWDKINSMNTGDINPETTIWSEPDRRLRVLITGSRNWTNRVTIIDAITNFRTSSVVFVNGGCPTGADRIAADTCGKLGYAQSIYAADWEKHGKAAGPIRNRQMVESGVDQCLAFIKNQSRGATGTVEMCKEKGVPVTLFQE